MSIKGNIGDWSEIYTLLKVLGDETLFAGDESLEKLKDVVYPVLKVLRTESTGEFEYSINQNVVFITSNGEELLNLPVSEFALKAQKTLEKIIENKKLKNTTFSIPEIETFMGLIHCKSLKASSSQKTDITIVIHDETPVAVVADVVTVGGILTDKEKPYTVEALSKIVKNLDQATKPKEQD